MFIKVKQIIMRNGAVARTSDTRLRNPSRALFSAWLDASQRSPDGVPLNRSVGK